VSFLIFIFYNLEGHIYIYIHTYMGQSIKRRGQNDKSDKKDGSNLKKDDK